jgi:hypothetical protein
VAVQRDGEVVLGVAEAVGEGAEGKKRYGGNKRVTGRGQVHKEKIMDFTIKLVNWIYIYTHIYIYIFYWWFKMEILPSVLLQLVCNPHNATVITT